MALLVNQFERSNRIESRCSTFGTDWVASNYEKRIYEKLNINHSYLDCSTWCQSIEILTTTHLQEICKGTISPFFVVNVRAWESKADAQDFGPSAWHSDGMPRGHLKLMIYLDGLGNELGSLEIEGCKPIFGPPGLAVLFKNSDLNHRARPPAGVSLRPVIEVTLQRTLLASPGRKPLIGHNNDKHLKNPYIVYQSKNFDLNKNGELN